MDLAVQGTMVMEIQPISSCNSETKKRNQCSRTISNKVRTSQAQRKLQVVMGGIGMYVGNYQEIFPELVNLTLTKVQVFANQK